MKTRFMLHDWIDLPFHPVRAQTAKRFNAQNRTSLRVAQALRAPPRAAGGTEASSCARYGAQALRHFATHGETKSFIVGKPSEGRRMKGLGSWDRGAFLFFLSVFLSVK